MSIARRDERAAVVKPPAQGSRLRTEFNTKEVVLVYARIARFEGGDTSQMEAVIDGARQMMDSNFDSPPDGLEGLKAMWMLVDRENARGLGVTLFENEEDLRRGDEALNAMSPLSTLASAVRTSRSTR